MKTMMEILDDTVAYYSADPEGRRAADPETEVCCYRTEVGHMCAVGRYRDFAFKVAAMREGLSVRILMREYGQDIFIPEAKGHTALFWQDLQYLHDKSQRWTRTGLSTTGEREVHAIRTRILSGEYGKASA